MRQRGIILLPILIGLLLLLGLAYLVYSNYKSRNSNLETSSLYTTPTLAPAKYSPTPIKGANLEKCYENNNYFVIEQGATDSVGGNLLVKYKSADNQKFDCKYVVEQNDFEIKSEDADYYLGLENKFLLIDRGTGPHPRAFIIYDLEKRQKVYNASYSVPVNLENNYFDYWKGVSTKVTKENCPEKDYYENAGLGTAIEEHVRLQLINMEEINLNESRCSGRQ